MIKCKSATLSPDGGIHTMWEDDKDPLKKYEIIISPQTAQEIINYDNENKRETP